MPTFRHQEARAAAKARQDAAEAAERFDDLTETLAAQLEIIAGQAMLGADFEPEATTRGEGLSDYFRDLLRDAFKRPDPQTAEPDTPY